MEQRPERDELVPPVVGAVLKPAFQVGALSGASGFVFGGVAGVLRSSTTPKLFATASSLQCFALGTTFWASRGFILHTRNQPPTSNERLTASTLAGTFTGGTIGGLIRGRANILPGAIMFSLFGYLGQTLYNTLDRRHTEEVQFAIERGGMGEKKKNWMEQVAEMKWSPMKVLSDEDYESMLKERLLRIEAEIALLDEEIVRVGKEPDPVPKGGGQGKHIEKAS